MEVKKIKLSNGETLAYRERGHGPHVLLALHGNLSSSIFMDILMETLPQERYRVLAPDLRGFGDSTYHQPVDGARDFAEDIKAFAVALGLTKFSLLGWSLGGLVAMLYAASYPKDLDRLVLIATTSKAVALPMYGSDGKKLPGRIISTREDLAMLGAPILATLKNKDKAAMMFGFTRAIYGEHPPSNKRYEAYVEAALKQQNKLDADYAALSFNMTHDHNGISAGTGEIDLITCPVLIVHGERDLVVPFALGQSLAGEIGENARLLALPAGHSPFTDCPELLFPSLMEFLEERV